MKIRCSKCGYDWDTRSKMDLVCCPNCLLKTKIKGELSLDEKSGEASHSKTEMAFEDQ